MKKIIVFVSIGFLILAAIQIGIAFLSSIKEKIRKEAERLMLEAQHKDK